MSSDTVEEASEEATRGDKRLIGEDIVTGYGNHTVIHSVSVESRDGVTCIFGPNGSGKSTLINSLNGAVPVWSGTVRFKGKDITDMPPYKIVEEGILTLPQDGGLFPSLTVEENLRVGGHVLDDQDVVEERVEDVFENFPILEDKRTATVRSLSGGQQMILSFGRATILNPDVYLLDEPSAGLAPSLIDDLIEMIKHLVKRDSQVVLVEQNVRAALRIADYVYILAQGELKFEGTPEELAEKEQLLDVYLGIE